MRRTGPEVGAFCPPEETAFEVGGTLDSDDDLAHRQLVRPAGEPEPATVAAFGLDNAGAGQTDR